MGDRASRRADLQGGAVWMVFGLTILVGAWRMDRFDSMGGTLYTAPGLVPALYGALLVLLGGVLALRRRAAAEDAGPLLNRRILWMLGLTLAYAALAIGRLPFGPITALFVATFCWTFDEDAAPRKRITSALIAGVATAVVVTLVFERIFLVRLP